MIRHGAPLEKGYAGGKQHGLVTEMVLRHISTVSYANLTVLAGKINDAQLRPNSGETSVANGYSLVSMNLRDIEHLSRIMSWEILYQQDRISVDKLKELHES